LLKMQQFLQASGMGVTKAKQTALMMINGLIQKKAFVFGMNDSFMVATLLTAFGVILVFFYGRKKHSQEGTVEKTQEAVQD